MPFLFASASTAVGIEWPPCNRSYNITECAIFSRADLPVFPEDAEYEVLALTHPVGSPGLARTVSKMAGFEHSGIGLRERNGKTEMNIQYWALDFYSGGMVIPRINDGTINWQSQTVLSYDPFISKKEWVHEIPLGMASGKVLNQLFDFVVEWHKTHLHYELWSAWNQTELGSNVQRIFSDVTCSTFTEDAINELYRLGAVLTSDAVLCRDYFVFNTDGPLEEVVPGTLNHREMLNYYKSLSDIAAPIKGKFVGPREILEVEAMITRQAFHHMSFIYDGNAQSPKYYKVNLKWPYLTLWPRYMKQRMVLPWQSVNDAQSKECISGTWVHPWATPVSDSSIGHVVVV